MHWSGEFLADNLALDGAASVLDMGTGSGIQAVSAAARGVRVLACDVNPMAVRCSRINAIVNGVDARIESRSALSSRTSVQTRSLT